MKNDKKQYPLRRVIDRKQSGEYMGLQFSRLVLLECGHMVPPSRDIYGETGALKQRCRLCAVT